MKDVITKVVFLKIVVRCAEGLYNSTPVLTLSRKGTMRKNFFIVFASLILFTFVQVALLAQPRKIIPATDRVSTYINLLRGKKIAVIANQTSLIGNKHLVDSLRSMNIDLLRVFTPGSNHMFDSSQTGEIQVLKVFSPEHGFRGEAEDGALLADGTDPATGIPVTSLYGNKRKPSPDDLKGIDLVLFDLQDVGVRFYTYISTLHYVMEACAENGVELVVLDRPNPNGFYVDGPVLDQSCASFVGMHPVPIVYGMTIGEYAMMINGEGWLADSVRCKLTVIPCQNYSHRSFYELPVKPSPNLPNMLSVYLYPSLCLFEGTVISVGRGTEFPFQVYGSPSLNGYDFEFTPVSTPGMSMHPLYEGEKCIGVDLRGIPLNFLKDNARLILDWLMEAYKNFGQKDAFFTDYFTKLAGTPELQQQIMEGKDMYAIEYSWQAKIKEFKKIRKKYLLYPDFE
jgi:uncharacterized protein YbbC (DUF1343 family)